MYRAPLALCIVGALLLIISIVLPIVFPSIFEKMLNQKLIIRPDSDILKSYKEVPIPIYFQVYMFNLTNVKDVLRGAKPKLHQLGPYTYRMQKQRVNVKFNHSTGTVSAYDKKYYFFEPELSTGKESDSITTMNLVFTSLAAKASNDALPSAIRGLAELMFLRFNLDPFMTHTVGEILFHGFDAPLLKELYPMTKIKAHKLGKTGFYYMKNGTIGPETEIYSGELGMENYQQIVKFEGKNRLGYWKEDRCNLLNGTEGSQFTKPIARSKPLFLFSPTLCRSVYLLYEKDVALGPLMLRRFVLAPAALRKSKENDCFCTSNFTCRSSVIDVSPCKGGSPIVVSTPHFLDGERVDIEAVEGLNPQKEEHQTFLDVEPNTGVTMRVSKRIQLNMPLRRFANFPALVNVSEVLLPIFWVDENALVPLDRANKLHKTLTLPLLVVKYGACGLLVTGIILILISLVLTQRVYKKSLTRSKRRQEIRDKIFEVHDSKLLNNKTTHC